ncbi:hypothetical protein E2C06_33950 [Dankookia rubra]|uniref:Uncharacterized protein n=1 Tax=Dankookia rubra TaxID=1442381 RepID=A0A4R5Q5K5_9PROT|nr:ankyrin repeat domain-containing protein [Dankookia rubra]TDH58182.1 hypothetical protein E2C06_33950 [Dankookia rubra]
MRRILHLAPLVLLAFALLPMGEAAAQFGRGSTTSRVPRDMGNSTSRPPPPALPGLQNRRAPDPIPADPNQVLSPNAALFDAINRGDLPAARDAVARGADLESRNVLGLTPTDAAVDQGRNEIMFYLLSVRGGTRVAGPPDEAPAAPPKPGKRGAAAAAARPAAGEVDRSMPMPAPTVRNPRLWAGDGGAPQPDIGFLGFDAGRPAGAVAPQGSSQRSAPEKNRRRS